MSTPKQEQVLSTGATLQILAGTSLREARNYFRNSPRTWLWVVFALIMLLVLGANAAVPIRQNVVLKLADVVTPGAFWLLLGIFGLMAISRPPVQFARRADAFLLPLSRLSPRGVVLWFTLRNLARWLLRMAVPAVILISDVYRSESVFVLIDLVCLALLIQFVRLGASMAGQRIPGVVRAVGGLCALAGVAMVAVALVPVLRNGSSLDTLVVHPQPIPPGNLLVWSTVGNGWGAGLLAGLGVVALAGMCLLAGAELYPEMWMSAQRRFRFQESIQKGSFDRVSEKTRSAPVKEVGSGESSWVPSGALVLAWKEWVTTSRTRRNGGAILVMRGVASALVGIAVGEYLRANPRSHFLVGDIFGIAAYTVGFSGLPAAQRLAADMGRPLWWISEASLSRRIAVVTLWSALVSAWTLAPALIAIMVFLGYGGVALALVPASFAVMWTFRAVALWVLTVFPSPAEARGPAQIVKGLIALAQLAVLAVAFGIGYAVAHSAVVGVLGVAVVAIALGVAGVVLSAKRIGGNGATFSRRSVMS